MSDYGFRISKPGFDVKSASLTQDQLAFSSSFNTFKFSNKTTGSFTINSGQQWGIRSITLTGYTTPPIYALFIQVNSRNFYVVNGDRVLQADGSNDVYLFTYIDSTQNPLILYIAADPNVNPSFVATSTINYSLYLGVDSI